MQTISRRQVQNLIENRNDLTIIDVLDEESFCNFHLPGAHNIPLDDSFGEAIEKVVPEKNAPVLVYCMDADCDASPKAARKLEELGYSEVYDYEAGKVDWKEAGLPVEQSHALSD